MLKNALLALVLCSAALCFARLHADETFLADMKKARAEFKRLSTAKKKAK